MATDGNATGGNLVILGDIEDITPKATKCMRKEVLGGEDSKIINHFFKTELNDISDFGCVKKEPNDGPVKSLIIEYHEGRAKDMEKHLDDLKNKVVSLPQKDIDFPKDKSNILADFMEENQSNKDLLLLPDIARNQLKIVGKNQEILDSTAHRFKVKIGEIKVSGRMSRQTSESIEDKTSYSSIVAGKQKNIYPDLDQLKKESSKPGSYVCSSSQKNFSSSTSSSLRNSSNSSSGDFRFETKLNGGMLLKVYKASITRVDVDAIVNAANDNMMHGGGVARVISEAAGYDLDKESRDYVDRHGPVKVSGNIVTTAGRLPYKGVIHAVGPMWHDYKRDHKLTCLDDLFDCVWNILEVCKKKRFKTVAMSAISAGIFAVPKELCADMYLYAAAKFSRSRSSTECPEELHIVDVDSTILQLVEQSVKRWEQDPESINQRITLPKYLKENPLQAGYSGYGGQGSYGGHRAGRRHRGGGENQQFGRNHGDDVHGNERRHKSPSPQNRNMEETLEITSSITKLPDEKFKWGGIAKRFIVDKQVTVQIYKGEITKVRQMDAIVCGTGLDLEPKGFISNALQNAGGYVYKTNYNKMKNKHKMCNSSDVFKCKAGDLGAKFVLHVASNRLVDASPTEMVSYKECMDSVLKKAKRNEMKTLAIPLFGTGQIQTNRRKLKLCGSAFLKALDDFLVRYGDKHEIREIYLVNNSDLVTDVLQEVLNDAMDKTTNHSNRNFDEYKVSDHHSSSQRSHSGKFEGHRSQHRSLFGYTGEAAYSEGSNRSRNENGSGGINEEESMEVEEDHYDKIFNVPDEIPRRAPSYQVDSPEQQLEQRVGNLNILEN